ncbi:DNA primase [Peptoniphilus sp. ING2-D1G]|nr:DNA primase [Peptoniphilus sp. ING2-D1G]
MSYIIDDNLLDEIRNNIGIYDLISEYVDLKKSGSGYMGLCPFHNEKTPSFSVSPSKGIFHCFGCGEGGDQITFIMKRENLGFREAAKFIADKYGIEVREGSNSFNKEFSDKRNRAYEANKEAATFFLHNLRNNKFAYEYLQSRDIDNSTIATYGIGYAENSWDSLVKYLSAKGYKEEELEEFNLAVRSKKGTYIDRFRNRIMFPIIDTSRRVIGFGGRVLDNSVPKYLNTKDTIVFNKGKNLYNLNIIAEKTDRSKLILVEGYMDVISLYKSGINYSIASLGTALTPNQADLIKRYSKEIYICYDSDNAGIKATNRAIDILIEKNLYPKIVTLPEGLDPDDYIKKYGKLSFEMELSKAKTYLDYRIIKIKENYNIESSEGLSGFTSDVAQLLSRVKNPIERDVYADKIAKKYGISKNAIISYINILIKNNKLKIVEKNRFRKPEIKPVIIKKNDKRNSAEYILIKVAMCSESDYNYIAENLSSYEFSNVYCRIIFEELNEYYKIGNMNMNLFLDKLLKENLITEEFKNEILKINLNQVNFHATKKEIINTVKRDTLENRRKKILKEIETLELSNTNSKGSDNIKELIKELDDINIQIQSF